MRRFVVGVILALTVLAGIASVASAHPAHRSVPSYPAGYTGPRISDHPAGACAGHWNVWADWVYFNPNSADNSIKVATSQEWEGDASNAYCGIMVAIVAVENDNSSLGEPMSQSTTEFFSPSGTYLGGGSQSSSIHSHNAAYQYSYGAQVSMSCGTTFHTWGSFLEQVNTLEDGIDQFDTSDGESIGVYGNTHDLCFT